jgi:hypothetical protein
MSFVYWVATIMIALMTSATAQQTRPTCSVLIEPVVRMTQEWDGLAWKRVREPCLDPTKDEIIEKEKERARQQQKQKQQQQDSGTDQ